MNLGTAQSSGQEELAPNTVEAALELEQLDANLFRSVRLSKLVPQSRAIFGGQIIGQSLAAAGNTIDNQDLKVHSFHAYFVRPGDNTTPALYYVRKVRDGTSFATRQVTVNQRGIPIFEAMVSFHRTEQGTLNYQDKMPEVPMPEELPTRQETWRAMLEMHADRMHHHHVKMVTTFMKALVPLEMRNCDPAADVYAWQTPPRTPREPRQRLWMKASQPLGETKNVLHACVAAYASDHTLVGTAGLAATRRFDMAASLDHSMWFHAPFRADEWMLYDISSSWAGGARAFITGKLFKRDGTLAVTVAQEGVVRHNADPATATPREPEKPRAKL